MMTKKAYLHDGFFVSNRKFTTKNVFKTSQIPGF